MTLKNKIRNAFIGLAVAGIYTSPQVIDYLVNGTYKVTQIGDGISKKVVHEYDDKIVVTGWAHPFGSMMIDEDKDGKLDEYWLRSVPARVPFNIKIDSSSILFRYRQAEYEILRKKLSEGLK